MGLFNKYKEPIFLKEDSSAEEQLKALNELAKTAKGKQLKQIEQDIKFVEAGIFGEKTIKFELHNSHMPMYVLHDLNLEFNGLSAQIDFLVITQKHQYVIECKNLYGNIEINNSGDFIRTVSLGRYKKKEGIYSPITQNKRHLELIKQIRGAEKSNIIARKLFENAFYNNYRSIVVLANPKTILKAKYAKKEIKSQVIRADQLSAYIRRVDADPNAVKYSDAEMESLAHFFLGIHKKKDINYTGKYKEVIEKPVEEADPKVTTSEIEEQPKCPKCGAEMIRRKATRGKNTGKEFYGCSKFPKCRGIISID